jgi:hypothetical protein
MRRIGAGLMVVGLVSLLVALFFREAGGATGSEAAGYLNRLFYFGGAACLAGAIVFSARKLLGRP